jgi:hypothetical protein
MAIKDLRSKKHEAGRRRVPMELHPVFDELVEQYKFSGLKHYGTPFVSYEVLADLVLMGWRPVAEPIRGPEQ